MIRALMYTFDMCFLSANMRQHYCQCVSCIHTDQAVQKTCHDCISWIGHFDSPERDFHERNLVEGICNLLRNR